MFTIQEIAAASKVDERGNLKLFSAMQMMQDCSQLWLESETVAADFFQKDSRAQLIVSRQVDVLRVPAYGERLTVTTSIFEFRALYGFRNTVVYDEAGLPCYVTWSMGAFVSSLTGKLCKLPQEVVDSITIDEKYPMEYLDRKIRIPEGEMVALDGVQVKRDDVDFNHHVNNAQYIRIAMEYLPEDFSPRRVRVEYKNPVRFGEIIIPSLQTIPDGYVVLLRSGDIDCCIIEFTK